MKKIISGKVRDVYDISDKELVIVTTDRISAYDVILPTPIIGKGESLNKISSFWFNFTSDIVANHMLSENTADMPEMFSAPYYKERTIKVRKLKMLPFEFVVRGYIFGNMWKSYEKGESFCGYELESGYIYADKLKKPILTPSTKAAEGHDEYISIERFEREIGSDAALRLEALSLDLYTKCSDYARTRGIIIADTKFEFGYDEEGNLVLADEALTPDSSRFWDAKNYVPGTDPASFDKQFVRDWLTAGGYAGVDPAPELPHEVAEKTSQLYKTCVNMLIN